jgi:diaminopimelate decarboxylase
MFIDSSKAHYLIQKYGSPLYVYDEKTLRQRCRELHDFLPHENLRVHYSAKANSNLTFLKIVKDEDIDVDAMSSGEIYMEMLAGFTPDRIFYVCNNVSQEEMKYAVDRKILVSADSLSQLETLGKINNGGDCAIRINPGVGDGHNAKVVTGGKKTKFGIQIDQIDEALEIIKKYNMKLVAINQHIGSLFLTGEKYVESVKTILDIAARFPDLKFVDFGGGFGVPYKPEENRLDLNKLSNDIEKVIADFKKKSGKNDIAFSIEPGRYISAECCILLGTVYSIKHSYDTTYIGTDLGMNVLARPVLYGSYHGIEVFPKNGNNGKKEVATIVGNICESGDIMAKDREIDSAAEGDIIGVMNAGAYGYSMSSNYNCRLRPAEVLIDLNGNDRLIRRRDTFEDLARGFEI